jgi:hypothetical protein
MHSHSGNLVSNMVYSIHILYIYIYVCFMCVSSSFLGYIQVATLLGTDLIVHCIGFNCVLYVIVLDFRIPKIRTKKVICVDI